MRASSDEPRGASIRSSQSPLFETIGLRPNGSTLSSSVAEPLTLDYRSQPTGMESIILRYFHNRKSVGNVVPGACSNGRPTDTRKLHISGLKPLKMSAMTCIYRHPTRGLAKISLLLEESVSEIGPLSANSTTAISNAPAISSNGMNSTPRQAAYLTPNSFAAII